jgi:type IV/VI secretion system ImpK/VasF family protein
MANVTELFAKFFAYVLLFEESAQQGRVQHSYEQVRSDIAALLEEQKAAARRQGMPDREYQDACFAAVAWADETILKQTSWEHLNRWKAAPLQLEYFQMRNAGEELFDRLERLRPDQNEVREVYYLALGLGFTGRYFLGAEDERQLAHIRDEEVKRLARPPEDVQSIDKLTPQPYEVTPPSGRPITREPTHFLLKVGLALVVIVPLLFYLASRLWDTSFVSAPPLTAEEIWSQLRQYACARITSIDVHGGIVTLGGRVASEAQRAELRADVQRIDRVKQVNDTLQIIPAPFCDVVELLEPFQKHTIEQQLGLVANLNQAGQPPTYLRDDNLIVAIQAPSKFGSYLYVDYYTADGQVAHLFPNANEPARVFKATSTYTIGQPGDPRRLEWKVQPPFGLELVTVIASGTPLLGLARGLVEPAQSYIDALRRGLPGDVTQAQVAATFSFIKTQDRP